MRKTVCFITFFTFFISGLAQGNGQKVEGVVLDAFTNAPLIGAIVQLKDEKEQTVQGTTTDKNGEFFIENVPAGRWNFEISYLGYRAAVLSSIMINAGQNNYLRILLEEQVSQLKEVTIKSTVDKSRSLNENATVSARMFTKEETERFAGSLGDPARMVANYAGVQSVNDQRNDIVIRGNSPAGVLWRLEGVEIANPNHFGAQGTTGGPVSMLNNNLLATSDFFSSAFPAEFGNALSGVFDLRMRLGNKNRFSGTGQVGFNGFEVGLEGPIWFGDGKPRGSFIANYRYSTLGLLHLMGFNFGTGTAIPKYQDFSTIVHVPTVRAGSFKFIGLLGKSAIELGRSFDEEEALAFNSLAQATDYKSSLSVYALTHDIGIGTNSFLKTIVSYQRFNTSVLVDTIDYINEVYSLRYGAVDNEDRITASVQFKHRFNSKNNITAGFNSTTFLTSIKDSAFNSADGRFYTIFDINNKTSTLLRAYTTWQHHFTNQLTLNAGVHGQFYGLNKELIGEPRIGLRWRFMPKQSLNIGYGLHSQILPRAFYFYTGDQYAGVTVDNTKVKSTRSHHVVLGHDFLFAKDFRVKTELYYQYLYNVLISPTYPQWSSLNEGANFGSMLPDTVSNKGKGQNMGIEVTFEKFFSKGYYILTTVSLFNSQYKGSDNVWRNTVFNAQYILNLLGGYELKLGKAHFLNFSVRGTWAGGNPYIPIDLDASKAVGMEVLDWDRAFTVKNPDYLRIDIRLSYKLALKKVSQEFAVDFQNILNRKNIFGRYYNPTTKSVGIITQIGFTPMFLYRIMF
jgi:hypothetical protein